MEFFLKEPPSEEVLSEARQTLRLARRIVVKVGTGVLMRSEGRLHRVRMRSIVRRIARLRAKGKEVVLVSSGAVGAGMEVLRLKKRPQTVREQQIAASIGQSRLMAEYGRLFAEAGLTVGQVLVTHDDLKNRKRHLNMRNTVLGLLERGFVPVVNENDVVSVDEIKVGDNDVLAALFSALIGADLLVMLSTTNGLRRPGTGRGTQRVRYVPSITEDVVSLAGGKGSEYSVGGMLTKLLAVETVLKFGSVAVIVDGRDPKNLERAVEGADVGTLFGAPSHIPQSGFSGRKKWIAFFHRARGSISIDEGAARAIEEKGVSLLPVGVRSVEGIFGCGDLVSIRDPAGTEIARGLVNYSSSEIEILKGKRTGEIAVLLGRRDYDEVMHRDNMAVLRRVAKEPL